MSNKNESATVPFFTSFCELNKAFGRSVSFIAGPPWTERNRSVDVVVTTPRDAPPCGDRRRVGHHLDRWRMHIRALAFVSYYTYLRPAQGIPVARVQFAFVVRTYVAESKREHQLPTSSYKTVPLWPFADGGKKVKPVHMHSEV